MRASILLLVVLATSGAILLADQSGPLDAKRIGALVKQLDEDRFETRERAEKELRLAGKGVVPLLEKELKKRPSLEVRRRLERIIHALTFLDRRIERLIRQLGSDRFEDREKAHKDLIAIGKPAIAFLKKAKRDPDLEIRRRSAQIIERIME